MTAFHAILVVPLVSIPLALAAQAAFQDLTSIQLTVHVIVQMDQPLTPQAHARLVMSIALRANLVLLVSA